MGDYLVEVVAVHSVSPGVWIFGDGERTVVAVFGEVVLEAG